MGLKVLCICAFGHTRSKYLAEHLKTLGYDTKYSGSYENAPNPAAQEQIDWADIIITIKNKHAGLIKDRFNVKGKKIIILEVSQVPKKYGWPEDTKFNDKEFLEKEVYPNILRQIKKHLPLKK